MTDTFCPIPWIFQAARSNGDARVCCQANVTKNKGVIRKPDGTPYNAGRDNLDDSRNAELMRIMRQNMLNGVWSEECGRCQTEEQNGLESRRMYENAHWSYDVEQARRETADDGSIDIHATPLRYYDLRFGNFCNLKCRMCGPTDSDSWYSDWIKLTGRDEFNEPSGPVKIRQMGNRLHADGYDWPNYEPFWETLEANSHNIEQVYFAGGEPMLIERHYDFLEKCVDLGVAKNMLIEYNTNATTLPTRVTGLWTHFREVRIGASVDGMGSVLEYQRNPAKWSKIHRNLIKIDQLPRNCYSWLAVTVTAYNVLHLPDFMRWKLSESGFERINSSRGKPIVTPHVAHHPQHLNIRVLPDGMKELVTDKYAEFVQWLRDQEYPEHVVSAGERVSNSVVNYMNSDSYHEQHWTQFKSYTHGLDQLRNERLVDVEPAFKEYL